VKTSILILDKSLAKKAHTIALFKVENDGFGLGAQRRAIDKNDLPQVQAELATYLQALRNGQPLEPSGETTSHSTTPQKARQVADYPPGGGQGGGLQLSCGLIVAKENIAANGDYNLSGERYREASVSSTHFPHFTLAEVCEINPRKSHLAELKPDTRVSFVPMSDINEHRIAFQPSKEKLLSEISSSYTYFQDNDVLLAKVTPCFENGKAGIARCLVNGIGFGSSEFYVLRSSSQVLPEWIYFCVMHPLFRNAAVAQMTGTGGLQRVPRGYVENFKIPLPPLEVQKVIVAEIEGYQKVINGARAVLDNYRPHIPIHADWPVKELSEVTTKITDGAHFTPTYMETGVPFLRVTDITESNLSKKFIPQEEHIELIKRCRPEKGDVLYSKNGTIGIAKLSLKIPLPPLATQQQIVAEIEAEQALVAANRELIARFEQKIQATLARVWGEEPPIPAGA
jgi:type I restriction enzyme M protein